MATRELQKRLKELAAALKAEPGSIPRRLELAAALRDAQRPNDAIDLYRGVAAVYAEEGRLVQAMAVCKGILEMDPEHRDTLEMLANLAQRSRAARRASSPASEVRQVDGRWVAEPKQPPTAPPQPQFEAHTPPSSALRDYSPVSRAELTPAEAPAWQRSTQATRVGDEPDATRIGADDDLPHDVRSALWAHTPPGGVPAYEAMDLAEAPPSDTDPAALPAAAPIRKIDTAPLDFDDATKRRARGGKLLPLDAQPGPYDTVRMANLTDEELAARETLGDEAQVPDPQGRHDTPVHGMPSGDDLLRTSSDEETRAAVRPALEAGRAPSLEHQPDQPVAGGELYGPGDTTNTLIQDAMSAPFPRPMLQVEPPPFPLLSDLPRPAFMELLARLEVLQLDAGTEVLREGDVGDACYLIASGAVRVVKQGVEVAVLGPGSFFGEFAVLADQRRHASVTTIERVELLEIRRQLLDELVAAHPGVARTLRKFYRERLLSTLMATAPFFERLQPHERAAIAERFRPRRFGRGARIIEEGSPGGGLFLILVGEVEVVRGPGEAEVLLGKLGEGSYFGEMSLLRGGTASATVRATRMTEVVQLPPRDFYEVVSQHPVLWEQLRSEAERREMANHAIVAGEARKSDDGTIYLV